jgi:hypothetical protein
MAVKHHSDRRSDLRLTGMKSAVARVVPCIGLPSIEGRQRRLSIIRFPETGRRYTPHQASVAYRLY